MFTPARGPKGRNDVVHPGPDGGPDAVAHAVRSRYAFARRRRAVPVASAVREGHAAGLNDADDAGALQDFAEAVHVGFLDPALEVLPADAVVHGDFHVDVFGEALGPFALRMTTVRVPRRMAFTASRGRSPCA